MSSSLRRSILAAIALIILRSAVWLVWEHAHFDSDQAIFGLMATHVADARAWPVFMYGQTYMLSLEAWLAAPLFALVAPSVALLKVPLVVMNIAIGTGLIVCLHREAALRPADALIASLFFLLPPPITSSRLVEAAGGNIEPLFFALVLWFVRRRPIAFGALAALAVATREFAWYAIVAVVVIDVWSGAMNARRLRQWGLSAGVLVAGLFVFAAADRYADRLGPDSAGIDSAALMSANVSGLRPSVGETVKNVEWLVTRNYPVLFGLWPQPLSRYNIASHLSTGTALAVLPMLCLAIIALATATRRVASWARALATRGVTWPAGQTWQFPAYLCLIALQASVAYVLAGRGMRDLMLIRYTLLVLFGAVGLTAWLLQRVDVSRRRLVVVAVLAWATVSATDHARLLREYVVDTPVNQPRALIAWLDARDVHLGRADYWTAYLVDFLSRERITLTPPSPVRILSYERAVDAVGKAVVNIVPASRCALGDALIERWCVSVPVP